MVESLESGKVKIRGNHGVVLKWNEKAKEWMETEKWTANDGKWEKKEKFMKTISERFSSLKRNVLNELWTQKWRTIDENRLNVIYWPLLHKEATFFSSCHWSPSPTSMVDSTKNTCATLRPSREAFERPFAEYVGEIFSKHPDWPCFKVGQSFRYGLHDFIVGFRVWSVGVSWRSYYVNPAFIRPLYVISKLHKSVLWRDSGVVSWVLWFLLSFVAT